MLPTDAPLDDWPPEALVGYGQPPVLPPDEEKSPDHQWDSFLS